MTVVTTRFVRKHHNRLCMYIYTAITIILHKMYNDSSSILLTRECLMCIIVGFISDLYLCGFFHHFCISLVLAHVAHTPSYPLYYAGVIGGTHTLVHLDIELQY